ncbi:FAST kinase domain-containing protein 2, mitochondrial-like [Polyodon spathula]|uniref:FAST kinase domain-containing protein 2, mitochondrial-like n=1 Tax=Polyodon spathula TaxID=7913 RepID=UPI001B7DDF23|nr:FAST kinase domain-containing protein 2, mitochondrial-like [Polyodon spathula]
MNICTSGNQLLRNFRLCLNNSHLQSSSFWGLKNCKAPINPSTFKNVHQNLGSTSYLFNRCATRLGATARFYSLDKEQGQDLKSTSGEQTSSTTDNPVLNETQSTPPLSYKQQQKEAGRYLDPLAQDAEPYSERESQREQFYDHLKNCNSPYDVLDLAGNYTLTWRRVSNSLTKIWETTKKMSDDQKRYERKLMFEHPVFEQLCQQAMKDAGRMRRDDLAYSLLALVKLGVSQRSRVVQTLLRVIQEHINDFDEKALSVLANCLSDMDSDKNADALKAGLRLLVETRIPKIKNVVALQTMMRCIGKDAPVSLKRKLEAKALSMLSQFSLPNSQYMFTTLAAMDFNSSTLLDACSSKIIENIHGIPFWRLIYVLQSSKDLQYRNAALFSAIAEYVMSTLDMWSNKQIVLFLGLFGDLGLRHAGLMDAFAEKVTETSESLTLRDVINILKSYSLLNHLPKNQKKQFLESLSSVFESYLPKILPTELLRGVYYFCVLGCFPQSSLDKLLQEDILKELLLPDQRTHGANERILHYINLCLELDCSASTTVATITSAKPSHSPSLTVNPIVLGALKRSLGDEVCQQGVLLQNDYFIDFQITLDKDRKFVLQSQSEENSQTEYLQRVAVLCAPVSAFCLGTTHPKGKLSMKMRHLTALGYSIVLVPAQEFEKLQEDEQVQFLKTRIFAEPEPALAAINQET